ncbi:MAG TPA: DNA polymerase I, partial [Vicinamibacterales bacterium]
LAHAGEIKQKKYREGLLNHADQARQSRELVTIRCDLDVPFELEKLTFRGADRERCYALFSKMEFRTLVPEYAPTAASVQRDYAVVDSTEQLSALVAEIQAARQFSLKIITDGTAPVRATLVGVAISTAPLKARYIPLGHEGFDGGFSLPKAEALAMLAPVLTDPAIKKIGHDVKADLIVLGRHGIELNNPIGFDTMLGSYLLDANRSSQALEPLALEQLGYKAVTEEDVIGKGVKARAFAHVPVDSVLTYAGERSDIALQLAARIEPIIEKDELSSVYRNLEWPLVPILAELERTGVRVDVKSLAAQAVTLDREIADLSKQIFSLAGGEFNIGSPKQLAEVLFERMQLPVLKRTGTARTASTAVEVLEELALQHDICRFILSWRGLSKLKGTYIDALPSLVNPETGRVHTQISQAVAATGRLSSSDPNLQNIPIRTEVGRLIRSAFIADPGNVLISADFSQIELRVLAHLSGDETLTAAFTRGDDIHDQTATKVFGADSTLDPYELRRRAKIINYALLYGKTAFTLAKDIGVTQQAAQQFIDAYFAGFPRVRGFIDKTLEDAVATGVVKTMFGRRRPVPELTSRNFQIRAGAERMAVNMPIQGTAADILKRAMIDVHSALHASRTGARMILTVHDELLFEAPKAAAGEVSALVKEKMSNAVKLSVPLDVDVGVGENWRDAKG